MSANDKCPPHYTKGGEQHWDRMWRLYGRGYFVGCATKYAERYHKKNGLDDLDKAIHFLEKLRELERAAADGTGPKGAEGSQPVVGEESCLTTDQARLLDQIRPYDQPTSEGSKHRWLDMMKQVGVKVLTPQQNPWGYQIREGVLWCPHCGCPHDSYDPFKPGLTCAQCRKLLGHEEERPCDAEKDHESHHFEPLPDYQGAACKDCGALSGMPSGKAPCPGGKKVCVHCLGTGVVTCEWSSDLTACPKCVEEGAR